MHMHSCKDKTHLELGSVAVYAAVTEWSGSGTQMYELHSEDSS